MLVMCECVWVCVFVCVCVCVCMCVEELRVGWDAGESTTERMMSMIMEDEDRENDRE